MKFKIKSIKSVKNLKGKRVLLRLDLNVPINKGTILDETRIKKSLTTISYLKKAGAKTIIISHLGDDGSKSLKDVARHLMKHVSLGFIPKVTGIDVEKSVRDMKNGGVVMLENLRSDSGEIKNNKIFAVELSRLGDIYVNEAFSASHRNHASIVSLPMMLPSFAGIEFEEEIDELSKTFKPKRPFLFILGGAKFLTKLPLIKKYLKIADKVFVGGAIMNPFFKCMGYEIGKSLADDCGEDLMKISKSKKIVLPTDVLVNDGEVRKVNGLGKNDYLRDMGPESLYNLKKLIESAKEIVFNGPLGIYELGFDKSTKEVIKSISKINGHTVVGGGDTLAVLSKLKLANKISFVSTAGGAMVEFLSNGTLVGIKALEKSKK